MMSGLVYVAVQQDLRLGGNDPQIQMAEDTAAALSNGQQPISTVLSPFSLDISKSLAPFITVFDDAGNPVGSSGQLDGKMPTLPSGVADYVRTHGEDRITWQPRTGVRIAAVITIYTSGTKSGFVLGGRSLREVESREDLVLSQVTAVWLMSLILVFVILFFGRYGE